ncbi:MAG TPA: energy transducer TonB [Spirochaetes bacterium]|nr:energy transducer TonB [Spirochaetota bacterium]
MNTGPLKNIIKYIYLRPPLMWSLISFVALLLMMTAVRWKESFEEKSFETLESFTVVELRMPELQKNPDIDIKDNTVTEKEPVVKEEEIRFGAADGTFESLEDGSVPPRPVFGRLPRYPDSMRKAGVEGIVVIELGIDESGGVVYGRIVKSLGREFDAAVIGWAKSLRFYPATTKERKPFRCRIRLPIRFKLEN